MRQMKLVKVARTKTMLQLKDGNKIFWAKTNEENYKIAKTVEENTDILVELQEEKGKLPFVKELKTFDVETEENLQNIEVQEHPPLIKTTDDYKEVCIKATAETLKSLQGLVDPNNISEVIKLVYKTYREL